MMKSNYLVHEAIYRQIKAAGWDGWGGNQRLAKAELVTRFFELADVPAKGKLLELGCGEGHHCRAFAQYGYNVTGIDISATAISWANEKAKSTGIEGSFIQADLTERSLTISEKYHVVIDGNCLHCIIGDDRSVFLNHVYRLLEDDGVFFVSCLCSKDSENHQVYRENIPYRHISSASHLVAELEYSGFSILKTKCYERPDFNHMTLHVVKCL